MSTKMYRVDVSALSAKEKMEFSDTFGDPSFMLLEVIRDNNIVAFDVVWNLPETFPGGLPLSPKCRFWETTHQ